MKFFWKIFFSSMILCIVCFSTGSYLLINMNFEDAIKQEINIAEELIDILQYSLVSETQNLDSLSNHKKLLEVKDLHLLKEQWIIKAVEKLSINHNQGKIVFRISNKDRQEIYQNRILTIDQSLLVDTKVGEQSYVLKHTEKGYFIQMARGITLLDELFYIEIIREVSHIFENQNAQYELFVKLILAMLVIGGGLTSIIARILIQPIQILVRATKEIGRENFSKTIPIKGDDELAILSSHFNEMSRKLEEKINELKEESEKRELFVASFSHELKTPLTSIIGYADMLRSRPMSQESSVLCANYIFEEGKRLEILSMRMLDIIVLKQHDLHKRKIESTDFFNGIYKIVEVILKNTTIGLKIDIEQGTLWIEPELMKTVCLNLIDNARKAIDTSGEIKIIGRNREGGYMITIQDNGQGMEEVEFEKIMQAFYRVDKSRVRTQGGTGLGLAICDQILKLHEAKIRFDSQLHQGTSVTIFLKGYKHNES